MGIESQHISSEMTIYGAGNVNRRHLKNLLTMTALTMATSLLSGCGTGSYDHPNLKENASYAYQALKTFCITPKQFVGSATDVEPLITKQLTQTLTAKGYQAADCAYSDFSVEFYARRTEEKRITAKPVTTNLGIFTDYTMEDVLTGALAVHLRDTKTKEIFWKNLITKESRMMPPEEGKEKRIQHAIEVLLERLPDRAN